MNEEISRLMDGELDTHASEQAIRDCGSPEGKQSWACYHMIGEVLREGASRDFDVSARVMAALDKEPTVLAPRALQPKPRPMHSFGRIALAAAASVATVLQGMPGASTAPAVAKNDGVTMQTNAPVAQASHEALTEPTYAAIEVNEYLAAHRQVPTPDQYRAVAARTTVPAR